MSKVSAVKNDIGEIKMEFHPDLGIVIHVDIFDWTKDNFRKSYKIWLQFMKDLLEKGFDTVCAAIPADDRKNQRFAQMYGFKKTEGVLTKDGTLYDVWFYRLGEK